MCGNIFKVFLCLISFKFSFCGCCGSCKGDNKGGSGDGGQISSKKKPATDDGKKDDSKKGSPIIIKKDELKLEEEKEVKDNGGGGPDEEKKDEEKKDEEKKDEEKKDEEKKDEEKKDEEKLKTYRETLINDIKDYLDVNNNKETYLNPKDGNILPINVVETGQDKNDKIKITCGLLVAMSAKTIGVMMSENINIGNAKSIEFVLTVEVPGCGEYKLVNNVALGKIFSSLKNSNNTIRKYDRKTHYMTVLCYIGAESLKKTTCYIDLSDGALFKNVYGSNNLIISHGSKDLGFDISDNNVYKLYYKDVVFDRKGSKQKKDVKLGKWVPDSEFLNANVFEVK